MDTLTTKPAKNIAHNLQYIRQHKNLSQNQLAKLSGVTRASIAQLETGTSNPSLEILLKLSTTLKISIDELISSPKAEVELIRSVDIPLELKSKEGIIVRKLLPHVIPSTCFDEMKFEVNTVFSGSPHTHGTREYFVCLKGEIQIAVAGQSYHLNKGDVLSFPGDRPHSYKNSGSTNAHGISVVLFFPE
jgi:transcriptional regulator with XRE-family HTH domain